MMTEGTEHALLRLGTALKQLDYRHITGTPATHGRVNARSNNRFAKDLVGVFGWSRPFQAEVIPSQIFELMQQAGIVAAGGDGWRSLLRASTLNDNLYFHSPWPTDAADAVFFGPDTYRYIAAISQHFSTDRPPVWRAADIGCGAGPGAIELALRFPQAEVLALDINDSALRLSQVNAALAGAQIHAKHSNLLAGAEGSFDLIVSNPPYMVDRAARAYRHGGGPLGAGLSLDIIDAALCRLKPAGTLLLYTGSAIMDGKDVFLQAVRERLEGRCSWQYHEIDPDVFGEELESGPYSAADRIAAVFLCASLPT